MSAIVKSRYTLEEYFELERKSEEKYEYFNGFEELNDPGDAVDLSSVDCALSLAEIYREVEFPLEIQPPIIQPPDN